ncbi:MAG: GNAT family N-acetyltransferase [Ardenticatenaceae bacterium]|nr:GNAT family N-acetyltransferase [Ardenticatenaceae bacterium]
MISEIEIVVPSSEDLPELVDLVNTYARRGDLLPRTPESIAATLSDWVIAKRHNLHGDRFTILGCGSLLSYGPHLAEVRSLAVADEAQGLGVGRKIVEALIAKGEAKQIPTLFALTRAVPFFLKLGFHLTDKALFPQKVWTDCAICPLKDNCDETAVAYSTGLTPLSARASPF